MNPFVSIRLWAMPLTFCWVSTLHGAEALLSVGDVARILVYPAEKLKVEEITVEWNRQAERRGRPGSISTHIFYGEDNTFARLSISVANESTLLTEEMRRKVTEAAADATRLVGTSPFLKWLTFDEVGYGISGLATGGPGGSDERVIMTFLNRMDIQVTVSVPSETRLGVLPGAEAYHELIYEGGISSKLIECLSAAASRVAGKPIKAIAGDEFPQIMPTPPSQMNAPQPKVARQSPKNEAKISEQPVAPTPDPEPPIPAVIEQSSTRYWWGIGALAILSFLAWLLLKRRST